MKKSLFTIFLLPVMVAAQADLYPVEDYYGGGIGFSTMYVSLDSFPGSALLSKTGLDVNNFTKPFAVYGGEGFTHISGQWRLGGYAGIGSQRISNVLGVKLYLETNGIEGIQETQIPGDTISLDSVVTYTGDFAPTIQAKFTFMLGAATLEYVVPIFRDLEIAAGALIGIGRVNLNIDQHSNTPRWNNLFDNRYGTVENNTLYYPVDTTGYASPAEAIAALQGSSLEPVNFTGGLTGLSGTFINFQPYVAIKWQLMDRVGLRLSVGYNKGTIGAGQWYLNDQEPIADSPESSLQGIVIRTMLYFGL
jgi:hypothetical protein